MKPINHKVPLIKQGLQECAQASATEMLQFYGKNKSIDEVKKEVPVYVSSDGKPLGTSLGHIASYFIRQGFATTIHTTDLQIFDRTWGNLSNIEIIGKLKERKKYISHPSYEQPEFDVILDGYLQFLNIGGQINFPIITNNYIYELLSRGPIFAVVNYQFLNSSPKTTFNIESGEIMDADLAGNTGTHSIVISGFHEEKYIITDPDYKYGGIREIDQDHLLGSIYLAETDYDNLLITLAQ